MTERRRYQAIKGAEHVQAAAALYSEPKPYAHYPGRVGEIVEVTYLPGERLEVVKLDDPSLVTLRHARGGVMRVGWRHVRRIGP